ncbi:LysR family transcriptional regulator [Epibacterium ulvae]|uniref:LysR family transcriptional regulator n=1 Tax=Epibacterium ulvae TaxID=1156985 RepID=UPI002490C620|nr:LysR family transcriptional regulator [Epibacterium ulvae]
MIELRDLKLLSALARLRHFARAAQECGMSQPAFSMRIRNLEERLGLPLVRRGNRFQGLTEEAEMIVRRARPLLDDARALEQEISAFRGEVTGIVVIGVIPTATAYAAKIVNQLHKTHPRLLARFEVTNALAIQQGLYEGTIDAGITYADNIGQELITVQPLYEESYVLFAPEKMVAAFEKEISWQEAGQLPLSLLEPQMQNRSILDRIFQEQGIRPDVMSESTGFMSAMIMAREGSVATILPRALIEAIGPIEGTRVLDLVDPSPRKPICLVTLERQPELTTVRVLKEVADAFGQ